MNKTTFDPETPIFGELNAELGELPEIVVHDFDWHGIEFGSHAPGAKAAAEPEAAMTNSGGRRRKES